MGFLNKIFKFMKPLLKPFGYVMSVVMAPITRIFLGIIDFVTGFYKGFTKDGEATFAKKLTNGIEGGVLGFIKGFTDAIDFILFGLPAWIAGKLGFDGVAECLKEFSLTALVDPAWEAIKDFFTTTIPGKMEEWKKAYDNFDPMEFITEKFEAVKCFFTDTIPNEIAKFNPLKDFDLIGSLTNSISELLASIVSIIPSGEEIKKMLINAAKLIPHGEKILKLAGLIPDPEAEAAAARATEAAMNLPAELSGASMDGTKLGTRSLTLANLERAKGYRDYGMSPRLARREGDNPDLVRRLAKEVAADANQLQRDRTEALIQAIDDNAAMNAKILQMAAAEKRDRAVEAGAMYTTNNYVAASQGSTDTESSWIDRYILGRKWQN